MPASKAAQKAVNKYVSNNYDRLNVTFPKGFKDELKALAAQAGQSVNEYIRDAITRRIEQDSMTEVPNDETLAAFQEIKDGKGERYTGGAEDFVNSLWGE